MKLPMTYEELRKQMLDEEGAKYPGKALVNMELEPGYNRAKNRMLPYIQMINEAHLIMLIEQGIVTEEDGKIILKALEEVDQEFYKNTVYDGKYEDLYFFMESRLIEATDGVAGNLHLARSRNDMCVAWSHLAVRDGLLKAMEQLLKLKMRYYCLRRSIKYSVCDPYPYPACPAGIIRTLLPWCCRYAGT